MFYSFGKTIRKQNRKEYNGIPDEVFKELNSRLPKGFCYKKCKNNILTLQTDGPSNEAIKINIENMQPVNIPERLKNQSLKQLLDYANNTQTEIKFKPIKWNGISSFIGKTKIPLAYNANTGTEFPDCEIVIRPVKFKKKKVVLSLKNGISHEIGIVQIKSNSESIFAYESVDDPFLKFQFQFDIEKRIMDYTVSLDMHGTHKINEVLKYLELQKGLLDLTIMFNDMPFCCSESNPCDLDFINTLDRKIGWWEQINRISETIDCELSIKFPISREDRKNLSMLYVGLVLNKPFKENTRAITEMRCNVTDDIDEHMLCEDNQHIGLISPVDLSCYGVGKNIYRISFLHNIKVKKVIKKNNKGDVILKIESKNPYCVFKYAVSKKMAEESLNDWIDDADFLKDFSVVKNQENFSCI